MNVLAVTTTASANSAAQGNTDIQIQVAIGSLSLLSFRALYFEPISKYI